MTSRKTGIIPVKSKTDVAKNAVAFL